MNYSRSQVDAEKGGGGLASGQPQLPTVAGPSGAFAFSTSEGYKHIKKNASARRVFGSLKTHNMPRGYRELRSNG